MIPRLCLALLLLLSFSALSHAEESSPSRILFIGNSITWHPPAESLGWAGPWGMAASSAEKDYVHLVVEGLAKQSGHRPEFRAVNAADFERGAETYDAAARLPEELAFHAGMVVLAIGENVPAWPNDEAKMKFKEGLLKLLRQLKPDAHTALYVRSCFWADANKDAVLKEACAQIGGVFVDISALGKDPLNSAGSERKISHPGVAGHPGDRGMRAIADALLAAMKAHS